MQVQKFSDLGPLVGAMQSSDLHSTFENECFQILLVNLYNTLHQDQGAFQGAGH
jgi:hypothetical protein